MDGYIHLKESRSILAKIDRHSQRNPSNLQERWQYLFEIDFNNLPPGDVKYQSYWLCVIYTIVKLRNALPASSILAQEGYTFTNSRLIG